MGKLLYNTGLLYNTPGLVYNGVLPDAAPILNLRKTTMLTQTEVFGFADEVSAAFDSNAADLTAQGVTATGWKTQGDTLKLDAVHQADLERDAKAALKDQSKATQAALQTVYNHYSTKLDAMAGALGKGTAKGKQLLRIRSKIRRGPNKKKKAGTTTAPSAPAANP